MSEQYHASEPISKLPKVRTTTEKYESELAKTLISKKGPANILQRKNGTVVVENKFRKKTVSAVEVNQNISTKHINTIIVGAEPSRHNFTEALSENQVENQSEE